MLISMMISGKSAYKPFLAYFNFYTPEYSLTEITKYEKLIFDKSQLKPSELRQYILMVFEQITVVPKMAYHNKPSKRRSTLPMALIPRMLPIWPWQYKLKRCF